MFIKDDMIFHNVSEFTYNEQVRGNHLIRVPVAVIEQLEYKPAVGDRGRNNYKTPVGCEIRFVMEEETATVELYSTDDEEIVTLMYGDFIGENIKLKKGYNKIVCKMHDRLKYSDFSKKIGRFTPNVVRIVFFGCGRRDVFYVSKEGKTRIPTKDELPNKTLLAYGTSITHSAQASAQALTYIAQTTRKLGVDLKNVGLSGSAYCEKAIAEHIVSDDEWDLATFCISVNMINQGYELDDYYNRISWFVNRIHSAHPTKHLFCISPFTFFGDDSTYPLIGLAQYSAAQYRDKVRQVVQEVDSPYVHYIHGKDMLKDFSGLSPDLLHPSDMGMIEIAENLSNEIKPYI